jgi:hypothetical protein
MISNIVRGMKADGQRILVLLILIDVALILLHTSHSYLGIPKGGAFSIEWEMGHGEVFQYIKEFWIASLLVLRAIAPVNRNRDNTSRPAQGLNLTWGLLFAYLLVDDSVKIHESLGERLAQTIGLSAWLGAGDRANSLGELGVNLVVAALFFGAIALFYRHCGRADRQVSADLIRLFLGLILFGVGVDAMHGLIGGSYEVRVLWSILEDGGEMLMMSLIMGYVFQLRPLEPLPLPAPSIELATTQSGLE